MNYELFNLLTLIAFMAAVAPAIFDTMRDGSISNLSNIILLMVGLGVAGIGIALGMFEFSYDNLMLSGLLTTGLAVGYSVRAMGGGVLKMCIAVIPWLETVSFIAVFVCSMLIAWIHGYLRDGGAPFAPPLAGCTVIALVLPILDLGA